MRGVSECEWMRVNARGDRVRVNARGEWMRVNARGDRVRVNVRGEWMRVNARGDRVRVNVRVEWMRVNAKGDRVRMNVRDEFLPLTPHILSSISPLFTFMHPSHSLILRTVGYSHYLTPSIHSHLPALIQTSHSLIPTPCIHSYFIFTHPSHLLTFSHPFHSLTFTRTSIHSPLAFTHTY